MKTLLPARAPVQAASRSGGGLLQRKCACGASTGNAGRCLDCERKKALGLQAKRVVGAVDDPAEREADRMAESVINPAGGADALAIRRRAVLPDSGVAEAPASVDAVLARGGSPLEAGLRGDMERRFGHDFSQVRVHTDAAADRSARELQAHAYTAGRHIVFAAGRYAPQGAAGRRLLAHELTHVVQQGEGGALLQRQPATPTDSTGQITLPGMTIEGRVCPPTKKKVAHSFETYLWLLECAESRLSSRTPREMLAVFRQLYYGKPWSNTTASQWGQVIPCSPDIGDPSALLGLALFDSLKASQSVGGVDFGHVFAGLEAMTCPIPNVLEMNLPFVPNQPILLDPKFRNVSVKVTDSPVSNEDLGTWAGDLGSAVAEKHFCLSLDSDTREGRSECRSESDSTSGDEELEFYLHRLAGDADLEGDIDPFVQRAKVLGLPCGSSHQSRLMIGNPAASEGNRAISRLFRDYYFDPSSRLGQARMRRGACFLEVLGGKFSDGRLDNAEDVEGHLAASIGAFAITYYRIVKGIRVSGANEVLDSVKGVWVSDAKKQAIEADASDAARWFVRWLQSR